MGFHTCVLCHNATSSGDVTLQFASRSWVMPDMILHYIVSHRYKPPQAFVEDVMNGELRTASRRQTKGIATPVGYLSCSFDVGSVPDGFVDKLKELMQAGERRQTRGVTVTPDCKEVIS